MTVIFETVHGSRAYGLATEASDTDLRGVFVPDPSCFTGYLACPEQVEPEPERVLYEIRKFFRLAAACNPTVIEVLFTDPGDHVQVSPEGARLLDARAQFLSRLAADSFGKYGLAQLQRIRTHRRWLLSPPAARPERAAFALPERRTIGRDEQGAVEALLRDERLSEAALPRSFLDVLDRERRYQGALREWQQYQEWKGHRNPVRAELERRHGYDTKHAMHLIRLLRMASEILETGRVLVRRPDAQELRAIRKGALTFDALLEQAESLGARVKELARTSALPTRPDEAQLNALCARLVADTHRSQLLESEEAAKLRELARGAVSKRFFHHYRGFFSRMREDWRKASPRTVKGLLYAYRSALTGIHLLRTGECVGDVTHLAPIYGFPSVDALVARKRAGSEQGTLEAAEDYEPDLGRLENGLQEARAESALPEETANEAALDRFLVSLRRGGFRAAFCLAGLLLLSACTTGGRTPRAAKVTLVGALMGPGAGEPSTVLMKESLARFEQETGIAVENVPPSTERGRRLTVFLDWLKAQAATPDVYRADVSEIGALAEHMLDLAPHVGAEAHGYIPEVMSNYWIDGRLVALPLYTDVGVLFYRTDLLSKYRFSRPPETWDELERMALKIQQGERAGGRKEFWGLAWPGRADDDLFCVAAEVQATHGGGRIIEPDRTISVNNPHTIRALTRMKGWIGRISPAGVTAYGPLDARSLWQSGNAAFLLSWPYVYARGQEEDSVIRGKLDVTVIPTGGAGHQGALGGWQFSVSKYSRHPKEAVMLLRFLTRPEEQVRRAVALSGLPPTLAVYDDPEVVRVNPYFPRIKEAIQHGTVARPWVAAGPAYRQVAEAYITAVYSVLQGKADAAQAMADLEARLVALTGFGTGPPPVFKP